MSEPAGIVYLVGAGPGDVGLLTLRGRDCLAAADLVLYDGLVNPALLTLAGGRCERTARVVRDGDRRIDQAEVNRRLIEAAREGLTVCRLKGGDPYIFGRGSEEAAALHEAGIRFEVVPGVTAATASGAYAGFSLTHRNIASAVALVTGHERPGKPSSMLDYAALAAFPGTLVFYMGLHRLPEIAAELIAAGLDAATPAAVVSKASLPEQRVASGPIGELPTIAFEAGLHPPSLIVVGECVRLRETLDWFGRRPLAGLTIAVCRPIAQCGESIAAIESRGGRGVAAPLIRIDPPESWAALDDALNRLASFDWIALTSANAADALAERLFATGRDARALAGCRIACVGEATAAALHPLGLRSDLTASGGNATSLAADLLGQSPRRVLFPAADRAKPTLPEALRAAGVAVESVVAYRSCDVDDWDAAEADWVAVTSDSIARRLASVSRGPARVACLSEAIAATCRELGLPVDAIAAEPSWDSLLDAIVAARR